MKDAEASNWNSKFAAAVNSSKLVHAHSFAGRLKQNPRRLFCRFNGATASEPWN